MILGVLCIKWQSGILFDILIMDIVTLMSWYSCDVFGCRRIKVAMLGNGVVGILSESTNKWERRVPLTPSHCAKLLHGGRGKTGVARIIVQPSTKRIHHDSLYEDVGCEISEDLSDCGLILGIKQPKVPTFSAIWILGYSLIIRRSYHFIFFFLGGSWTWYFLTGLMPFFHILPRHKGKICPCLTR